MSTRPITITVEEDFHDYVQQQVEQGRVRSVSAYFNEAVARRIETERRADAAWRAAVEKAQQNPEAVARARRRARKAQEILSAR
ncbi:hypothetical protein [Planobispora longispora]|uniref:Uncharacterized protein n=1 Tax=Planobispora longispora TaxID=28887 RepID=A0A8J3RZK4_9ACTN|nr:hypothetical protein [Planobispora longispora]BFE89189.1 hypothetical protein GCM10020093_117910 [Planobispora longispora]BFE89274.1 hypothetical protein GCM10020093_118760 [Planobispora longispora]BFE89430.1 hypothetical protein GCM10020093_120320 [Planobispora longispora]GIH80983.1 hypothetical protein Plo01_74120 [Planobispora longispora]